MGNGEHREVVSVLEVSAPSEIAALDRGGEAGRGGVCHPPVRVRLVPVSGISDKAVKGGRTLGKNKKASHDSDSGSACGIPNTKKF
jgi:hypothetical protein